MTRAAALIRRFGLLVLGVVVMIVGIVLLTRVQPMSFRWAAYAPLTNFAFVPPFMTGSFVLAGILLGIGIALTAGWIGYAIGLAIARRRPAVPPSA